VFLAGVASLFARLVWRVLDGLRDDFSNRAASRDGTQGIATEAIYPTALLWQDFLGAVAQFVREQTAERSKAGQERSVARGLAIGPLPPGYVPGPDKVLMIDPDTVEIVRQAFQLRADGANSSRFRSSWKRTGSSGP
jgi:DNA invertase Pin-like site-specific DNA recombinase